MLPYLARQHWRTSTVKPLPFVKTDETLAVHVKKHIYRHCRTLPMPKNEHHFSARTHRPARDIRNALYFLCSSAAVPSAIMRKRRSCVTSDSRAATCSVRRPTWAFSCATSARNVFSCACARHQPTRAERDIDTHKNKRLSCKSCSAGPHYTPIGDYT